MINRISELAIIDETSYAPTSVNTSSNVITLASHGLINGCKLRYDNTNWTIGGLTDQADYFVVNVTTNTFQLSETLSGSAVDLTSQSGSGTAFYVSPIYLKNITEGVDGSSVFGFDSSQLEVTIEDGQTHFYGVEDAFDIRTLKDSEYTSNLSQIADNSRNVYVSGLTPSGFIMIGDKQTSSAVKLAYNEQFSNPFAFSLLITKTASPMWDKENSLFEGGMWSGENGLGIHLWGDNDSDGLADGWSLTNEDSNSFSNGSQTVVSNTTEAVFSKELYFPFNKQVTFNVNFTVVGSGYATKNVEITFYDIAGNIISNTTQSIDSTGNINVTATGTTATVYASCSVNLDASSGTSSSTFRNPVLRRGTTSTYTKF